MNTRLSSIVVNGNAFSRIRCLPFFNFLVMTVLLSFSGSMALGQGPLVPIIPRTQTPPVLDGRVSWNEWNDAYRLDFEQGFIKMTYDRVRLYILIDVLDQNVNDSNDYFYATFDVDMDGEISPEVDLNYSVVPSTRNIRYQYYLGASRWTGLQPGTLSALGIGYGAFFADGSIGFQMKKPFGWTFDMNRHRVWELGIDLDEIDAGVGQTITMGLRIASSAAGFSTEINPGFTNDFSKLRTFKLADGPLLFGDASAIIGFGPGPVEITQAIQDLDNSLPLVAQKKTAARVYVRSSRTSFAQPVWVYLHGRKGAYELPGSPLAQLHFAPLSIDREEYDDSANFILPDSWTSGTVEFEAKVRKIGGAFVNEPPFNLSFVRKEVPTVWIVPINTGTAAAPNLVDDDEIALQEEYMKRVYPLHDINFVRKPWTEIGPTTVSNAITELRDYHSMVVLAWVLGAIFTGDSPFDLPMQIYGFCPSGGGSSDPYWYFGEGHGYVARGFIGTSRELTMAHEINHNLDLSVSGTWGRHAPFDCGAAGPDSAWPYTTDDIQEVGFDTGVDPLDPGTRPVVPVNWPDFMSYCQSPGFPTKWISPYRWNHLFDRFPNEPSLAMKEARFQALFQQINENVYYISGTLYPNGSGELDPVLIQPGIPEYDSAEGDYSLQMVSVTGQTLVTVVFPVTFVGMDNEKLDRFDFDFRIPLQKGVKEIVLRHGKIILDRIEVSETTPSVKVLSPNGGEHWSGLEKVQWAMSDPDKNVLSSNLLYSPDNGMTWIPIASQLSGDEYVIDTRTLPGSDSARMRVIVSDGFRTAEDDSDEPFAVEKRAPQVSITSPLMGYYYLAGQPITFQAEANDLEDAVLPETAYAWFLNGEVFGMGSHMEASLPPGDYEVTVLVQDSDGMVGEDEVTFMVREEIPLLNIERLADGRVKLSWPAALPGVLQYAISAGGTYHNVGQAAEVQGDRFVVILEPNPDQQFFRVLFLNLLP
jgi:hypothetical protein